MNGKLISTNPRFAMRNVHSSELMISSVEFSDEGQYECRTDEIINYILQLIVVNCKCHFLLLFDRLIFFS